MFGAAFRTDDGIAPNLVPLTGLELARDGIGLILESPEPPSSVYPPTPYLLNVAAIGSAFPLLKFFALPCSLRSRQCYLVVRNPPQEAFSRRPVPTGSLSFDATYVTIYRSQVTRNREI